MLAGLGAAATASSPSPVVKSLEPDRPFAVDRADAFAVRVARVTDPVVALDVRFGDGARSVVGRPCREGEERVVFSSIRHRYRRRGRFTVTVQPVTLPTCDAPFDDATTHPGVRARVEVFARRVRVPDVVGLRPLRAKCRLEKAGLSWRFRGRRSRPDLDSCEGLKGEPRLEESTQIAYQSPRAGRRVPPGTVVQLDDCAGRECV
jgi:hypothetical protein